MSDNSYYIQYIKHISIIQSKIVLSGQFYKSPDGYLYNGEAILNVFEENRVSIIGFNYHNMIGNDETYI